MNTAAAPLLRLEGVSKRFGGLVAVDGVGMTVTPGEIRALIGPNGAGKTTLLNMLSGFYTPSDGRIEFTGVECTRMPAHVRARMGLARTFQTIRLFKDLSALENVMAARTCRSRASLLQVVLGTAAAVAEEVDIRQRAQVALERVGLTHRAEVAAGSLPYGEQRLLEMARALATDPQLILLDEPVAGMNPNEVAQVCQIIRRIRDSGITVLLVEHNMRVVMDISDRISVLDFGRLIAEGTPAEVRHDPAVIAAYLGQVSTDAAV